MRARCLAHVSLQRFRVPTPRFPRPDLAGFDSPASSVPSRRSDFPPSIPPRSLSFAKRYHGLLLATRQRGVAVGRPLIGTARRCLDPLPSAHTRGDGGISQVPRQPLCEHALLSDPGGLHASGPLRCTRCCLPCWLTTSAPHSVTFRGSITQPVRSLSTLRSSDYSDRTPRKTRFPLAANLGGAGLSPAGFLQEVSTLCFNSHRFLLLEALLAHQPA